MLVADAAIKRPVQDAEPFARVSLTNGREHEVPRTFLYSAGIVNRQVATGEASHLKNSRSGKVPVRCHQLPSH